MAYTSEFNRVKKFSCRVDKNYEAATISEVSFRQAVALPKIRIDLCARDLQQDHFHRKKQLAKLTTAAFLKQGYISDKELLDYLHEVRVLHPVRTIALAAGFERKEE